MKPVTAVIELDVSAYGTVQAEKLLGSSMSSSESVPHSRAT